MSEPDAQDLEESLLETLKSSQLGELPADLIDAFTGFPVANSLAKLYRGTDGIRDYLFRKKVVRLIASLSVIEPEERRRELDKLLRDPEERMRFGEQLLLVLDRFDDTRKAAILGHLAVGLVKGDLSLAEFWRMSRAVEAISLDEEWPILQVVEKYKFTYYGRDGLQKLQKDLNWLHDDVLRNMVQEELGINISDGDLRSIVIGLNQTGLFGCLGWRNGPAHDCELAPWYFELKKYMKW